MISPKVRCAGVGRNRYRPAGIAAAAARRFRASSWAIERIVWETGPCWAAAVATSRKERVPELRKGVARIRIVSVGRWVSKIRSAATLLTGVRVDRIDLPGRTAISRERPFGAERGRRDVGVDDADEESPPVDDLLVDEYPATILERAGQRGGHGGLIQAHPEHRPLVPLRVI